MNFNKDLIRRRKVKGDERMKASWKDNLCSIY